MAAFFLLLALVSSLAVGGLAQDCGSDPAILNFALNLEYLEANFYSCAAFGHPISQDLWGTNGVAPVGCVKAKLGAKARAYAETIAMDELKHVIFLRTALGAAAVDQPLIDLAAPFVAAANLALNTTLDPPFNYYLNEVLFYHAAFIFEDVGVTAYKGAAALITCKDYLTAAAGILSVEAYHGGAIRTLLLDIKDKVAHPYGAKVKDIVQAISNLRALASGEDDDRGLLSYGNGYIVAPGDINGVAFSRNTSQVLNIVYLTGVGRGGFFPNGLNGAITTQ